MVTAIGIGVSSAYAANIQLAGDSTVAGNLAVTGEISGPTVDAISIAISEASICPAENIQHWNKIVFLIGSITYHHPTLPALIPSHTYEMIVQVDPSDINEVKLLVAKKLNADGYTHDGQPVDPNVEISGAIETVSYSTICAEN